MRFTVLAALLAAAAVTPLVAPAHAQAPADATTAATPAPARTSDDPDDRIRCRRIAVTGSLVRTVRVCKTLAEWRRMANGAEGEARDYVEFNRGRPSGN